MRKNINDFVIYENPSCIAKIYREINSLFNDDASWALIKEDALMRGSFK